MNARANEHFHIFTGMNFFSDYTDSHTESLTNSLTERHFQLYVFKTKGELHERKM